jgi:hypothetical protein
MERTRRDRRRYLKGTLNVKDGNDGGRGERSNQGVPVGGSAGRHGSFEFGKGSGDASRLHNLLQCPFPRIINSVFLTSQAAFNPLPYASKEGRLVLCRHQAVVPHWVSPTRLPVTSKD